MIGLDRQRLRNEMRYNSLIFAVIFPKKRKEAKYIPVSSFTKHVRSMYFYFRKLIQKKAETLHYCFAIGILIRTLYSLTFNLQPPNFNLGHETRCDKTISVIIPKKRQKIIYYQTLKTDFGNRKKNENFFWPLYFQHMVHYEFGRTARSSKAHSQIYCSYILRSSQHYVVFNVKKYVNFTYLARITLFNWRSVQ